MAKWSEADRRRALSQRVREDDDEEISEDGAFNSEDERRYGHLFEKKDGGEDASGDDDEGDEDDDELAGDENEPTLLDMMDGSGEEREEEEESESEVDEDEDGASSSSEDEGPVDIAGLVDKVMGDAAKRGRVKEAVKRANAAAGATARGGGNKLRLDTMMGSLKDRPEFGQLKKRLERLEETAVLAEPQARVVEERAERKAGYEKAAEDIGKWAPVVHKQRAAKHLSFPLKAPGKVPATTTSVAASFEAGNDLEREIQAALEESGLADARTLQQHEEQHLLEVNKLDPEQIKERQAELAKLRALMFYGEQKAKRSKKIKSKMYRRLKKRREARIEEKAQQTLMETDPEAAKELAEKAALDRAKERMTLRHKNTSKFVRGLLKNGGTSREHTREAIVDQLAEERRLRQRMKSLNPTEGDSDDDSDREDATEREQAAELLSQIEKDQAEAAAPTKGLFALKFMQRGLERDKAKAKEDAEMLVRAIESGRLPDDEAAAEAAEEEANAKAQSGRRRFGGPKQASEAGRPAPPPAAEGAASAQAAKSMHVDTRTSTSVRVQRKAAVLFDAPAFPDVLPGLSASQSVKDGATKTKKATPSKKPKQQEQQEQQRPGGDASEPAEKAKTTPSGKKRPLSSTAAPKAEAAPEANPWLATSQSESDAKKAKKGRGAQTSTEPQAVDAVQVNLKQSVAQTAEDTEEQRKRKEQARLIKRAFAGTGALSEDFQREKEADETAAEEAKQSKETKMFDLPGWGSWAGDSSAPSKPSAAKRKREQEKAKAELAKKAKKAKKKGPKHVVVSEKRNKKSAKYMVAKVPYPFTSREQYEASLRNPLGSDWNTSGSYQKAIKPAVVKKSGTIIDPIRLKDHVDVDAEAD